MKNEKLMVLCAVGLFTIGAVLACVSCYYAGKSAGNVELYEQLSEKGLIKE